MNSPIISRRIDNVLLDDQFSGKSHLGTFQIIWPKAFFSDYSKTKKVEFYVHQISSLSRQPANSVGSPILIKCNNFLIIRLVITRDRDCVELFDNLNSLKKPENIEDVLCFSYYPLTIVGKDQIDKSYGWQFHDMCSEFQRLGMPNNAWKLSSINQNYEVSDTYPNELYVPASVSSTILQASSKFRSKGRLPVLTYLHTDGRSAICRSSQPLAGFTHVCTEDESLLLAIMRANAGSSSLRLVDARPRANAMVNAVHGKGTERTGRYQDVHHRYFDIENIHRMRSSLSKLVKACQNSTLSSASFLNSVDKSGWLKHVKIVLETATYVAKSIHEGESVLVHCSDGWDRTSQVVSLAQLMLDPFYRTLRGFQVLFEKDWLHFGHKFTDRCRLLNSVDREEMSPIVTQFLDCVYQMWFDNPSLFEFNIRFLMELHDNVHLPNYGTFFGNCEKDRIDLRLSSRTYSFWGYVTENQELFINSRYSKFSDVHFPSLVPQSINVWKELYNRWESDVSTNYSLQIHLSHVDSWNISLTSHIELLEKRCHELINLLGKSSTDISNLFNPRLREVTSSSSIDTHMLKQLLNDNCLPSSSSDDAGFESGVEDSTVTESHNYCHNDAFIDDVSETADLKPISYCRLQAEKHSVAIDFQGFRACRESCSDCKTKFNVFDSVRYCYSCGLALCDTCVCQYIHLPGHSTPLRSPVCLNCVDKLEFTTKETYKFHNLRQNKLSSI